jgi:phospholipid N-methyltransferase
MSRAKFLFNFFAHPARIGSVTPSSKWLIHKMVKGVDFNRAKLIVEYGPGTGCITEALINRLQPHNRFAAFEVNPGFVTHMEKNYQHPQFELVADSAARVVDYIRNNEFEGADYIISGLPFTTLPKEVAHEILEATHKALVPGGQFIVYQYSLYLRPKLREYFTDIKTEFTFLNVPPAFVFTCTK